jgi:hypothetical protein
MSFKFKHDSVEEQLERAELLKYINNSDLPFPTLTHLSVEIIVFICYWTIHLKQTTFSQFLSTHKDFPYVIELTDKVNNALLQDRHIASKQKFWQRDNVVIAFPRTFATT